MDYNKKKTIEEWVSLISNKELPAIASTVKVLDKFSNDDKSSLPMLSKSILHDQILSSCILKSVNNAQRIGLPKINTVSRATVILGIQAVKNICLTSTVLDALFESKKLTPNTYQKLSESMARSFYAGVLAKMLVSDYNEDTQEQIYIASMLYSIGETAFWSVGGDLSEQLLQRDQASINDDVCKEVIGCTFNDISLGLARIWNLGHLLEKSLDNPELRTGEVRTIYLANKLSAFITNPPESSDEFIDLLGEISRLKNVTVPELKRQIGLCRAQTITLLSSYGAAILEENIKPLPLIKAASAKEKDAVPLSEAEKVLNAIKALSNLTKTTTDINQFFQFGLKTLLQTCEFEQATLFIFTQDKKAMTARFHEAKKELPDKSNEKINLLQQPNIISYMLDTNSHLQVTNYRDHKWLNYISGELGDLVRFGPTSLSLIKINERVVGLISGQYAKGTPQVNNNQFQNFCFIVEHMNMCLSKITK
ncbi:MAG: HDOD domain-containing protein [Thalassotalea sp.]